MIKNMTRLEHEIDGNLFHFFCDPDSPVIQVKEALEAFMAFAIKVEQNAAELAAQLEAEKEPKVVYPSEVSEV